MTIAHEKPPTEGAIHDRPKHTDIHCIQSCVASIYITLNTMQVSTRGIQRRQGLGQHPLHAPNHHTCLWMGQDSLQEHSSGDHYSRHGLELKGQYTWSPALKSTQSSGETDTSTQFCDDESEG